MIKEVQKDATERMDKTVQALQHEFATVRTGRANPGILDKVLVDYYGQPTPLQQIASVGAPEAQLLVVQPYDPNATGAIEKAIMTADLGLNPSNDGTVIRIPVPALTEERRKELVKLCRQYAEEARVAVRNIRRDAIEAHKKAEREHDISEDELRRSEDEIQKMTDEHTKRIDEMLEHKEEEILEV